MKKTIHKEADRGKEDYGWLTTAYSFSFANWYNPQRMGFGKLRVINDDSVAPGSGFAPHSHRDMEIITIVMSGVLTHKDSLGNVATIKQGEVQVMSAGSGVTHSEYNDSKDEELRLFQIWIETKERGVSPRYDQNAALVSIHGADTLLVSPSRERGSLQILQDAYITYLKLSEGTTFTYQVKKEGDGVYLFCIEGALSIDGEHIGKRDAMGIEMAQNIAILAHEESAALIIEVPIH